MRKWESLDREWVSKSNVMEQGAWVQEGGEEYMSRVGFSAHPMTHITKAARSGPLTRYNARPYDVYNPVFQSFIEYGSLLQNYGNMILRVKRPTSRLLEETREIELHFIQTSQMFKLTLLICDR